MDTIFALATAPGRAGVSVVRLSGPDAHAVARGMCQNLPDPGAARVRTLRTPAGEVLDHALILRFDAPASFTGEDVVEFHLHGSLAVVTAVERVLAQAGARLAEPGEFTRRALENDKLDLAQVEALGDLIAAETEAQRIQAQRVLTGALGARIETWRSRLIRAASLIEATIDFADEDVPVDVTPEVQDLLGGVIADIHNEVRGFAAAQAIRQGFEVAIVGPPNAGKSTLLNMLARRDVAITSATAGTTRDVIEVRMDIEGLAVTLLDTAGLRTGADEVEAEGVARAITRAQAADLRVFLAEPGIDLMLEPQNGDITRAPMADIRTDDVPAVSGKTGHGVQDLLQQIASVLRTRVGGAGLITHERHRQAMEQAQDVLQTAQQWVGAGPEHYDIAAEELRVAIRSMEAVTGRIDVETLLDEIFATFCLGK